MDGGNAGSKVEVKKNPNPNQDQNASLMVVSVAEVRAEAPVQDNNNNDDDNIKPKGCTFNPCKCCCGGNLRQACLAIAVVENILAILCVCTVGHVPFINPNVKNVGATVMLIIFWWIMEVLVSIAMTGAMYFAVLTVSKISCLVHSGLATLQALLFLSGVISIIVFWQTADLDALCNPPPKYEEDMMVRDEQAKDLSPYCSLIDAIAVTACVFGGIEIIFFIYSAIASLGLYTQFRAGNFYDGDLIGGDRVVVQGYVIQYQYKNNGGQPQLPKPAPPITAEELEDKPEDIKI